MPNQHSPDKIALVIYLPVDLKRRLVARSAALGVPTTELQERYLDRACRKIPIQTPSGNGGVTRCKST